MSGWRKTILASVLFLSSGFVVLAGCAGSPLQSELNANERKWAEQNVSDYQYTLRISAFAPLELIAPVAVEVRNGTAVSVKYKESGLDATNEFIRKADTVDKLFDIIQKAIDDRADEITVEYDAAYGYPKQISIDPLKTAIDEEIGYTVSEFSALN